MDQSYDYHSRALNQFLATIGRNHHRTGDIQVKMVEHQLRKGDIEAASTSINAAIAIFSDRSTFRPELARATFWKSQVLDAGGDDAAAHKLRQQSVRMYSNVTRKAMSGDAEPTQADFDDVVAFWSR
ncbi:hypothetical protein NX059_002163 [Plenodomus lindquistii]|nr:hypothetical protein NX059_002163 [Plenodomus lindquistii]